MTVFFRRRLCFVMSILWLAMLPGCTTTALFSKFTQKGHPKATADNPAVRCLCLWEPAEGTGVDNKPARGVSGQIFFFTRNGASSVEIDGDVRVFLFDDQGSAEEQAQPLHQYEFLGGAWKTYLTSTQFGPAYQLFVPYPRKGRHQAELALRVRLTQPNGAAVFSDIAKVVLTGYDRSKAGGDAKTLKPDHDEIDTLSVGEQDDMIPKQVEQSLKKVLSARHGRRGSAEHAVLDSDAHGEFSLSDRLNGNGDDLEQDPGESNSHSRVRLRLTARNRKQAATEDEE